MRRPFAAIPLLLLVATLRAANPAPIETDISYGPHPHQILDVYVPAGKGPFPVIVWYGGLWRPAKHVPDLNRFFPKGCAAVAVQTRTLTDAYEAKAKPPVSWVMDDACLAIQFLRANAKKWGLDPERIAVGGGSQGSLSALYVGCAKDRAKPDSADPVERASSRVRAVAAYRSQPSIDPKRMQEWVPGVKWGAPSLGYNFEESLARREELLPIIQAWSPDAILHKDAAPIYFENEWGLTRPEGITEENYKVHSPAWALGFQEAGAKVGATVLVKFPGHPTEGYQDIWDFLIQQVTR